MANAIAQYTLILKTQSIFLHLAPTIFVRWALLRFDSKPYFDVTGNAHPTVIKKTQSIFSHLAPTIFVRWALLRFDSKPYFDVTGNAHPTV
ncbi:hypothetical protein, partial [Chlorogloeopsis fritschii]